jgi:O-methyltransferase involved in polyketide biosynthesis
VAAYRAIHQTLEGGAIFCDPFAARILDDETRARLGKTAADASLRPMRLFIAARSRFSEDTLGRRADERERNPPFCFGGGLRLRLIRLRTSYAVCARARIS